MSDVSNLVAGMDLSEEQILTLTENLRRLKSEKLLELDSDIARAKEGMRVTKKGLDVLAKAVAGKELRYTKATFGDSMRNGVLIEPSDEDIANLITLIHGRDMELPLVNVAFGGNGSCVVKCLVNNAQVTEGFWAREIGLWAKDPDTGEEILYAYKNVGALGTYIIAGDGAVTMNLILNLITIIDQATNVTAVIDASLVNVSQADFDAHIYAFKPHPNVPNSAAELSTSDFLWAAGSDNQLHPISVDNLANLILGDNLYKLSRLQTRIAQNEINISNLFMQLDAEKQLGLDANLLLFEDFTQCDAIDLTDLKVDDTVAGINSVCLPSADGIREGCCYTLSDGVKSQNVRVKSVAKNDNLFVVIFEENLKYTFNLAKAHLYRSTGLVYDNKMSGSGDMRSSNYNFAEEWRGESSSSEVTLTLETTLKNSANFTLSGDYAFSDGYFTLA